MSTSTGLVICLLLGFLAGETHAIFNTLLRMEKLLVEIRLDLGRLDEALKRRG